MLGYACLALSWLVLPCLSFPCLIQPYHMLPCPLFSLLVYACLALSWLVLPCLLFPCVVQPYLMLPCPLLSFHVYACLVLSSPPNPTLTLTNPITCRKKTLLGSVTFGDQDKNTLFWLHILLCPPRDIFYPQDQHILFHDIYLWFVEKTIYSVPVLGLWVLVSFFVEPVSFFVVPCDCYKTNIFLSCDHLFFGLWGSAFGL